MMTGQMNIFDFLEPTKDSRYKVGEYIKTHGSRITPADLKNELHIGDLIVVDKSTNFAEWYKVGKILNFFQTNEVIGGATRIVIDTGGNQHDLCNIRADQPVHYESVFAKLYFLPKEDDVERDPIKVEYAGSSVRKCPSCGTEVYRKVKIPSGKGIVEYNLGNCTMCGQRVRKKRD